MSALLLAEQERLASRLAALIARAAGWIDPPLSAMATAEPAGRQPSSDPAGPTGSAIRDAAASVAASKPTPTLSDPVHSQAGSGRGVAGAQGRAGRSAAIAGSTSKAPPDDAVAPLRAAAAAFFHVRRLRQAGSTAVSRATATISEARPSPRGRTAFAPPDPARHRPPGQASPDARPEERPPHVALRNSPAHVAVTAESPRAMARDARRALPEGSEPYMPRRALQDANVPAFAMPHASPLFAEAELEERIAALLDDALTEAGTEPGPDLR